MGVEALNKRYMRLEAQRPDADRSEIRAFLAKFTDAELDQLIEIRLKIDEEQREPTEEEERFFRELVAKYGA